MKFEELFAEAPYSMNKKSKQQFIRERLAALTEHHKENCAEYANILESISYSRENINKSADIPFVPVRIFKELSLKSVPDNEIVKTMTSSGTTGQAVSKIYLDRTTSANQQKAMVKIVSSYIGNERMPMIVIDCPSVIKNRSMFSARGAGILGFSMFGTDRTYILKDEDMSLDTEKLEAFLEKHKGRKILLFGFTFMIWQHFYKELIRLKEKGIVYDLSEGILIHGGGWKKLQNESVSPEKYKQCLESVCGIKRIHDYYGMVEQTGCIYMECEYGHLHASNFSDVIVRNPKDFSECAVGERGILQVISTIPESYPGHSLLTEDEGAILGEDNCPCGRNGKYFRIFGRIKNAEIRGCSDTYSVKNINKKSSADIEYVLGNEKSIHNITSAVPKVPFANDITEFCDTVSKEIFSDNSSKKYPDIVTLGFWLRKSNIMRMASVYGRNDDNIHLGRGVLFHIAPSNVPVNFAYSLFSGLICGNANIVKVTSKNFPQIDIIINALKRAVEKYPEFEKYIYIVRYNHDTSINDMLSGLCDVRVIWGGDKTIEQIRKSPLNPRASEVTFADRYSVAVIDSETYLTIENKKDIAHKFWNDTFLTDQNACTSPRAVIFLGSDAANDNARDIFWKSVWEYVSDKYDISSIQAINKLTSFCIAAAQLKNIRKINMPDNTIYRVYVNSPDYRLMNYKDNSGYFFEYACNEISDAKALFDNTGCQTISYIGNKSSVKELAKSGIKGIDRIVPTGHTMDFDLLWDGYEIVERLSRTISYV